MWIHLGPGLNGRGCKTKSTSLHWLAPQLSQTNNTAWVIHSAPSCWIFQHNCLLWLTKLIVFKSETPFLCPCLYCCTDVFRHVVKTYDFRLAPRQEMIWLNSRITRSEGKHKSSSTPMTWLLKSSMTMNNLNILPSVQLVVNEIHATHLIKCLRYR